MKRMLHFLLFTLGLAMTQSGLAQGDDLHRITGFRSASFGMSAGDVRAAIQRDFGLEAKAIREVHNAREATTVLAISVPELEPGPGAADIYYILGATSQRLMHVNVVWSTSDTPSDSERDHIAIAGMQLTRYFTERNWKPDGMVSGVSLEAGEVLLFAGVDPTDAGVEVLVNGVTTTSAEGETTTPSGPASLRVSYMQRMGQPDVVSVDEGAF